MSRNGIQFQRHTFDALIIAQPVQRLTALLLDVAASILIGYLLRIMFPNSLSLLGLSFVVLNLWWILWLVTVGWTPGMKLFKLQVYTPKRDREPDVSQVALRVLGFWLSVACLGTGFSQGLYRRDRRTWCEILSETVVLGTVMHSPGSLASLAGQFIQTLQILVICAAALALPLSPHASQYVMESFAQPKSEMTSMDCEDPSLIVQKPSEVLSALIISPAWAQCWDETKFGMASISDSQLFWVAKMARVHFTLSGFSTDERATTEERAKVESMNQQWCQFNGCDGKRQVASTDLSPGLRYWLQDRATLVGDFLATHKASDRIQKLRDRLKTETSPLVRGAIQERLWSETAFNTDLKSSGSAEVPIDKISAKSYIPWLSRQMCWMVVMNGNEDSSCQERTLIDAVETLETARNDKMDDEDVEGTLEDFKESSLPPEFSSALLAMTAAQAGETNKATQFSQRISEVSPLYFWVQAHLKAKRATSSAE